MCIDKNKLYRIIKNRPDKKPIDVSKNKRSEWLKQIVTD